MLVSPESDVLDFIFRCDVIISDEVIRYNEYREDFFCSQLRRRIAYLSIHKIFTCLFFLYMKQQKIQEFISTLLECSFAHMALLETVSIQNHNELTFQNHNKLNICLCQLVV